MSSIVMVADPAGGKTMLSGISDFPTVKVGSFTLGLNLEDPPRAEVMEKARKELRETPETRESAIKELRQLLKEEEGLYAPYDNEAWMCRYLRPTKFYPESALNLIKNYYEFKVKHKNIYDSLLPSNEKNVFSHDIITVLPRRDQDGRRILVLSLGKKWKHKEVTLDEVYKGAALLMEAAMLENETQISGVNVIFDMEGLSLQQTWQFTPPFAKRIVDWLQDSVPLRVNGIHIINQPYIFNMVFALFKPFLRDKLRSRPEDGTYVLKPVAKLKAYNRRTISIYFHGTDRKALYQHLDPSCLPEIYGGTLDVPNFHAIEWYNMILSLEKEYEKINSYGYKKNK